MRLTRAELARFIDHTLLNPTATVADVARFLSDAEQLGVFAVCVSPSALPLPLIQAGVKVATVCGFPSGKHTPASKAFEAGEACANGADEVDMVIDLGNLKAGRPDATRAEVATVREAMPADRVLKVIIESAALSAPEIVVACRAAEDAGADFVKTSTGFHPAGGASEAAVRLMAQTVGGRMGVKASGEIRSYPDAVAMIAAGATRLGLSGTAAILAEAPQD